MRLLIRDVTFEQQQTLAHSVQLLLQLTLLDIECFMLCFKNRVPSFQGVELIDDGIDAVDQLTNHTGHSPFKRAEGIREFRFQFVDL